MIRNVFTPENVRMDTSGRAIFFNIENITLGNVYLHSGTDGLSRGARENYCSETIPQLLMNRKESGCWGGDLNCVTRATDCTHNPESKLSPSLTRLINTFNQSDSFRCIYPNKKSFSHFYRSAGGQVGASRIDRSYHWGNITILDAEYISVAFSDHCAYVVKMMIPDLDKILPPQTRPLFKISPEVVHDKVFKTRLEKEMVEWQQVKSRGLSVMQCWELIVKPGIRKLALNRSKELNKIKRSRMNCLLLKQSFFT